MISSSTANAVPLLRRRRSGFILHRAELTAGGVDIRAELSADGCADTAPFEDSAKVIYTVHIGCGKPLASLVQANEVSLFNDLLIHR